MIHLLCHIVEERAAQRPNDIAFRCDESSLTYEELAEGSSALAGALKNLGVRRGDRVGILLNKSIQSALAIYGILKSGAAYVPLDPFVPASRVATTLEQCGGRHLIASDTTAPILQQMTEQGLQLDGVVGIPTDSGVPCAAIPWKEVASMKGTGGPDPVQTEDDLAYLMYTSGSTGIPKGIMHSHRSGLAYARMAQAIYGVGPEDRLGNHSPLHFDMSTFDYFAGPLGGATTVVIPEAHMRLAASLSALIEQERLTIWYSVPFALVQLLLRGALESRDISTLRWVLFGGEPFPRKYLDALMELLPDTRFSNVYGPAEVNQCTYYHVPRTPSDGSEEPVPIGAIWPNAEGIVVDDFDRTVPDGTTGELLVRTPTMMMGYWGRPDLTDKAIFRRTLPGCREEIYYRTGDLVYRDGEGRLIFAGRADRQVKVRGHRIELDEIEAALVSHAEVEEAAVFVLADNMGTNSLCACVVLQPGLEVSERDLIRHVSRRLPRYAVPEVIEILSDLPRTASGKIDRTALAQLASVKQPLA